MSLAAPEWLIAEVRRAKRGRGAAMVAQTRDLLDRLHLPTVCESARCPNRGECFSHHTATFLILGEVCTRDCAFCAVKKGRPLALQADEPQRLARAVAELGLRHVVITSVTRDDLPDGGAAHYARVVEALREHCPGVRVELLVPDFAGSRGRWQWCWPPNPTFWPTTWKPYPGFILKCGGARITGALWRFLSKPRRFLPG